MKHFISSLLLLSAATAGAQETVSIDLTTGKLTDASGIYCALWSSNDAPVWLTSVSATNNGRAANMTAAADKTSLMLYEGSSGSSNYVLSTLGSRRIARFELTFTGNDDANPVTVTSEGQTLTSTASEQTLTVTSFTPGKNTQFTLTGANKGITATSLKVHLEPTSAEEGVCVFPYTGVQPWATVYRIPVVAYIPAGEKAGRLVAVNDFRPCGMDIGYGEVDLHISLSDDGGQTWSAPADLVDAQGKHVADGDGKGTPATSNANRDCGFGDPSLVADCETGELLMMGVCGRIPIGQATRAIPQGLALWRSKDGGDTWTMWKDITEDILTQLDDNCTYGAVDGLFFTAGRMVQSKYIKVGSHYRVYVVGGGRSAAKADTQCWVFYTDDFGENWHILGDPYKPAVKTAGSEPKCEELPDGSILFSGRASEGVRRFNIFTYTDYERGEGWWDTARTSAMASGAPSCNGDALILPVRSTADGSAAYLLMQSTPMHTSQRVNVGINYKVLSHGYDHFGTSAKMVKNWDGAYQCTTLPSAYSSLTAMADGTVGFIYEESTFGKDYCEIYRNLTIEQITSGAYTYAPDEGSSKALSLTRELVEGKLAYERQYHADRAELLANLETAAAAFQAEPSTEAYLNFNRHLNAIKTNTPIEDGIRELSTDTAPAQHYDLLGRRIGAGFHGPAINSQTRKIEIK